MVAVAGLLQENLSCVRGKPLDPGDGLFEMLWWDFPASGGFRGLSCGVPRLEDGKWRAALALCQPLWTPLTHQEDVRSTSGRHLHIGELWRKQSPCSAHVVGPFCAYGGRSKVRTGGFIGSERVAGALQDAVFEGVARQAGGGGDAKFTFDILAVGFDRADGYVEGKGDFLV